MIRAQDFLREHTVEHHGDTLAGSARRGIDGDAGGAGASDEGDGVDRCREAALRILDAADRPSGAVRRRLCAKGFDDDTVEEVLGRLARVGVIDDESYARRGVRYCVTRMMGARGTLCELRRKGVDADLAQRMVTQAESQGLFERSAWELGRSVAQRTRGLDVQVRRRRFWGAVGRKGHDPDALRSVERELFLSHAE